MQKNPSPPSLNVKGYRKSELDGVVGERERGKGGECNKVVRGN